MFAARNDPDLYCTMVEANSRNHELISKSVREVPKGRVDEDSDFDILWTGIFVLFEGLVVEKVMRGEDEWIESWLLPRRKKDKQPHR